SRSGLSDEYNIAYRNFSRNIHSTDFTELLLQEDPNAISSDHDDYVEDRNGVCCEVALVSVVGIDATVNGLARLGLDRRFTALRQAIDRVRNPDSALSNREDR